MKICSKCKVERESICFGPDKRRSDGLRSECKECRKKDYYLNHDKMKQQKRLDYLKHKEERKLSNNQRYIQNKDKILDANKKRYQANKEKIDARNKIYYLKNREKTLKYYKEYGRINKERLKAQAKAYRQSEAGKESKRRGWKKDYEKNKNNLRFKTIAKLRKFISRCVDKQFDYGY